MRSMRVIYKMKSNLIQEFWHHLESRLIEVMNHEMLPIQFVSNVNWIQMWLITVVHKMKSILSQEFQHSLGSKLPEVRKWKCFRFNSCEVWIWFKCDWWKHSTGWKTFWATNFKIWFESSNAANRIRVRNEFDLKIMNWIFQRPFNITIIKYVTPWKRDTPRRTNLRLCEVIWPHRPRTLRSDGLRPLSSFPWLTLRNPKQCKKLMNQVTCRCTRLRKPFEYHHSSLRQP
jgi:hypothetical protein